jgi:NADH-quinone oxidoreductase subunit N
MTVLGFVFFLAGVGFKISLVPFHQWAGDVYEGAPTGVTAYLSVVSKGAGVFTLLIMLHYLFSPLGNVWYYTLWVLTVLTITIGNLFALRQKDIKRFFAFSSISQAGYLILGLIAGSKLGVTTTVYYLATYLFSNLAVFGVITAVENHTDRTDITAYNGLRHINPQLAFVFMLSLFSLAGIPPLAGFFGKLFIFTAIANEGEYILLFIALANTVISLYYYLLIIKAMFLLPETAIKDKIPISGYNRISMIICVSALIMMGLISGIYGFFGELVF